tara:strand:- start:84 stop:800 length:717 start_codon:yes stop_codon:yes gene_type:complete
MNTLNKNNVNFFDNQSESIYNNPITKFYHMSFMGKTDEQFVGYIKSQAGINKDSNVLDMGCGSGYLVNQLSELCVAEGISNSPINIKVCKNLYPDNKFTLAEMETYKSDLKSHILTLESFIYSDVEKSFKNCYNNLSPGGTLFMKEWFSVEDETKESEENCRALEETFFYFPKKLSTIIELAEANKFRLISEKNLLNKINSNPYIATLPYHNESVKDFIFPHPDIETVIPFQLKFIKI